MILSRQHRIYSALWRKALISGFISLNLETHYQAIALRLAMYRFLKPYRNDSTLDDELFRCAETLALCVKHGEARLVIKPKVDIDLAEVAMLAGGLLEDELLSEGERKLMDMSEGIEEIPDDEAAGLTKPNPFYKKGER